MAEKTTLNVTGMSCGHCVKTIEDNVGKLDGVKSVQVNLEAGTVDVEFESGQIGTKQISDTIEDQGFDVA
ncbi:copper chaperone CopZ [Sporosarcina oncorhynchi]|uniref:Copper chaperone CopZ n=1 Tax=Sporosarcina oncorhynchi TaxID=3056444 RepID=A0ABZ0L583_9BACL|nr:copper chaperone CopZ [Sporosarcina sp. T2O-4]WOV87103.1 copper chaperone CopZ [Sporosarcina sp. T2O-4]